tara:strand:+ start:205 stop:816 length:612 start_codon:yes stop_codon:yes gene_type:complete
MAILVVNNRSSFLPDLCVRLTEFGIKHVVKGKKDRITKKELKKYKGVILSGGPLLLDKKMYLDDISLDIQVLLEENCPLLGICLGHQILSEMHGAKMKRLKDMVKGKETIKLIHQDPLFRGLKKTFKAREAHHECIAWLPDEFEHLATSKSCKYEAIKHIGKPIYGLQFHPEVSGKVGKTILKNFLKMCGEKIKPRKVRKKKC